VARRKRKEDAVDWTPPEFDEVDFMRKEIAGAKAAVVTITWAFVGALVSFLLYRVTWVLAFFAGLFVFAGLLYVMPLLGVRTSGFKRRDWAGHGGTYFFSWLAFWIILLNIPVSDITPPTIDFVYAGAYSASLGADVGVTCAGPSGGTIAVPIVGGNDTFYFLFRVGDNVGVGRVEVKVNAGSVTPEPAAGDANVCRGLRDQIPRYPEGTYVVRIPWSSGSTAPIPIEITASDAAGHTVALGVRIQPQT